MDMYVIKCDKGYLKISTDHTFTIVSIQKASVYMDVATIDSLLVEIGLLTKDLTNIRIAKLQVIEQDYFRKLGNLI